jgi:hypothetical protein
MALSRNAKIAIGLAAAAGGVGYYLLRPTAPAKKTAGGVQPPGPGPGPVPTPGTTVPPRASRDEPEDGWQARLAASGPDAVILCRDDAAVKTFAEAQACILGQVFFENPPWGGSTDGWQPWMFEARQGVRDLIQAEVEKYVGGWGGPGWQFSAWLMFDRLFDACRELANLDGTELVDEIADCMADQIWPEDAWPPTEGDGGWQNSAYDFLRGQISAEIYGPPVQT